MTTVSLSDLDMMEEESIQTCGGEHHPALAGGTGTTKAFFIDNLLRLVGIRLRHSSLLYKPFLRQGGATARRTEGDTRDNSPVASSSPDCDQTHS